MKNKNQQSFISSSVLLKVVILLLTIMGSPAFGSVFEVISRDKVTGEEIWQDRQANLIFEVIKSAGTSTANVAEICAHLSSLSGWQPWILPTGYPESQNKNFGNKTGDLNKLVNDGVLQVVPGLRNRWFWVASPVSPYYATMSMADDNLGGKINYDYGSNDGSIDLICIAYL